MAAKFQLLVAAALVLTSDATNAAVKSHLRTAKVDSDNARSLVRLRTGDTAVNPKPESAAANWAEGAASWQQATTQIAQQDEKLWTEFNYCDSRAIHGSAPLTLLFGISKFWGEIKHGRASLAKPLEVHVLGAAYPFEGRGDWALLASRRPPDVPKVRIVLVLGTPWQQDSVPVMQHAREFDEAKSFLQLGARVRKPDTGHFDGARFECPTRGSVAEGDLSFLKADLCKDHGNGLEVVCIEKKYQDMAPGELPKPDVVAMFSPGFPQIGRRSWDQVLQKVLTDEVPLMVVDVNSATHAEFANGVFGGAKRGSNRSVDPGGFSENEDCMTLEAMQAYGARSLGAFQNPFPILINYPKICHGQLCVPSSVKAKNAVLQVFRGRLDNAEPLEMPSKESVAERIKLITALNLKDATPDDDFADELKTSMLVPTTTAYDKAMWQLFLKESKSGNDARKIVQNFIEKSQKDNKSIDKTWMASVKELGLTGKPRLTPWSLQEWIFVMTQIPGILDLF